MGESPSLWTWVSLKATFKTLSFMPEMIASRRLQRATSMVIRSINTQLLGAVSLHPTMREVDLHVTNLSSLPPAINGLESVNMNFTSFNHEQTEAVPLSVSSDHSKVRKLDLGNSAFSISVSEAPVCRSSIRQIEATLRNVPLIDISSSMVTINLMSAACSKLLELNLDNTQMTGVQANEIFTFVAEAKTPPKVLRIGHNQLSSAGADLMGDAVGRLTELDMCQTSLLPDQVSSSSSSSSLSPSQPLNLLLSDQVTRSKLSSVLPPEISRD